MHSRPDDKDVELFVFFSRTRTSGLFYDFNSFGVSGPCRCVAFKADR